MVHRAEGSGGQRMKAVSQPVSRRPAARQHARQWIFRSSEFSRPRLVDGTHRQDSKSKIIRGCRAAEERCDPSGNCRCNSPRRAGSTSNDRDRRTMATNPYGFMRIRIADSPRTRDPRCDGKDNTMQSMLCEININISFFFFSYRCVSPGATIIAATTRRISNR